MVLQQISQDPFMLSPCIIQWPQSQQKVLQQTEFVADNLWQTEFNFLCNAKNWWWDVPSNWAYLFHILGGFFFFFFLSHKFLQF